MAGNNLAHLNDPVINLLYLRLASMLQDDALDPDESLGLLGPRKEIGKH